MSDQRTLASALEPEFLILGLLSQAADHGYGLQGRIESQFRWIWRISLSQTYNILKRLENQGDLLGEHVAGEGAPPRRIYRLSAKGQQRFDRWLTLPAPSSARAIRIEFLTKLHFALASDPELAQDLIRDQEQALREGLHQLQGAAQRAAGSESLGGLALDLRIRQLETALSWLQGCQESIQAS